MLNIVIFSSFLCADIKQHTQSRHTFRFVCHCAMLSHKAYSDVLVSPSILSCTTAEQTCICRWQESSAGYPLHDTPFLLAYQNPNVQLQPLMSQLFIANHPAFKLSIVSVHRLMRQVVCYVLLFTRKFCATGHQRHQMADHLPRKANFLIKNGGNCTLSEYFVTQVRN